MQKGRMVIMSRRSGKMVFIIVGIVVAVTLFIILGMNSVPNKAISYEEQISTAESEIQIQEKRRADLIPNLVDCVKEYDKHEYETLMKVVKARGTNSDSSVQEIQTMISAVAEAYVSRQPLCPHEHNSPSAQIVI